MLADLPPDIQRQVGRGISILRRGGIVAFPTDTAYGLGACANLYQAVERVYSQFGGRIDLVIDGSGCPGGRESTIVDVTGETPVVLQEGAISREELRRVCGSIVFREGG